MGFFEGLDAERLRPQIHATATCCARILVLFQAAAGAACCLVSIVTLLISLASASVGHCHLRGMDLVARIPSLLNICLVAGLVLPASGCSSGWSTGSPRGRSSQAIAEVVLQLATDAFEASVEHDLSFYDEFSSGQDRFAHHLRYAGFRPAGDHHHRCGRAGASKRSSWRWCCSPSNGSCP